MFFAVTRNRVKDISDKMGCCNPEGLKHLAGTGIAKWQALTGGSLFITG